MLVLLFSDGGDEEGDEEGDDELEVEGEEEGMPRGRDNALIDNHKKGNES